jgi:hypothetical protein
VAVEEVSSVLEVAVPVPDRSASSVNNPVVVLVPVCVSVESVYEGVLPLPPLDDDDPAEKKFSSDSPPDPDLDVRVLAPAPNPRALILLPPIDELLPTPPLPEEVNSSPKSVNELVRLNELLLLGAITLGSPGYKYPSLDTDTAASSVDRPWCAEGRRLVRVRVLDRVLVLVLVPV